MLINKIEYNQRGVCVKYLGYITLFIIGLLYFNVGFNSKVKYERSIVAVKRERLPLLVYRLKNVKNGVFVFNGKLYKMYYGLV